MRYSGTDDSTHESAANETADIVLLCRASSLVSRSAPRRYPDFGTMTPACCDAERISGMRSSTLYGIALLILGVILGWWLANRPLDELDEAVRARIDTLDISTGSVPLVALLLIIVIVILLVRD